jgi:hypothetical protein
LSVSRAATVYHHRVECEMKGLSLRNYVTTLASIRGEAVAAKVLASVSPELRAALQTGKILPSGWYPVAWKRELHAAGREVTGEPRLAWTMGAEMTKRDLGGIYRAFLRIVSPRFVLSAGSRIFSTYFRPGSMRVVETRSGFVRVVFDGCAGFDRNMWQDVLGGCQATLEAAGANAVRLHIEGGGGDRDTQTTAIAWWTRERESVRPPAGGDRSSPE